MAGALVSAAAVLVAEAVEVTVAKVVGVAVTTVDELELDGGSGHDAAKMPPRPSVVLPAAWRPASTMSRLAAAPSPSLEEPSSSTHSCAPL